MSEKGKNKLTFRAEGLAVPEIITGEVPETDELETDTSIIQYDTVAIPEIHLGKKKSETSIG